MRNRRDETTSKDAESDFGDTRDIDGGGKNWGQSQPQSSSLAPTVLSENGAGE